MNGARVFEAYPEDPYRTAVTAALRLSSLFVVLFFCGILLDMYPTWTESCGAVDKEIAVARGIHDSSTCLFFRDELSPEETRRWQDSAKAEGDKKCIAAAVVLAQNVLVMKVHHFFYQYIPWAPGTAYQTFKDVLLYLLGSTPVMYLLTQAFWSLMFRMPVSQAHALTRIKEMSV